MDNSISLLVKQASNQVWQQCLKASFWRLFRAFIVTSTQNHWIIHLFSIIEILNKYKIIQDHWIRKFTKDLPWRWQPQRYYNNRLVTGILRNSSSDHLPVICVVQSLPKALPYSRDVTKRCLKGFNEEKWNGSLINICHTNFTSTLFYVSILLNFKMYAWRHPGSKK